MANNESTGWEKWVRNGRLSGVCWVVTFGIWIYFKKNQIPLEGLDVVFILMSSVFGGNLGVTVIRPGKQNQTPPQVEQTKSDGANE